MDDRPNGGSVVLYRSLWVSLLVFLSAIGVREAAAPGSVLVLDLRQLVVVIGQELPWFGAIFAGVYAAFYARFASQWTYLAGLYNQIMATLANGPPPTSEASRRLDVWQAGFIEDAEELHLARKPMFAGVIQSMLRDEGIRTAYVQSTVGGHRRLRELEESLRKSHVAHAKHGE